MPEPSSLPPSPPHFPTVGVIGAGQLARMMQPAAVALGVSLRVLATAADESAAQVTPHVCLGKPTDPGVLESLAMQSHVVTCEHEHVPAEVAQPLVDRGYKIHPSPSALLYARDKVAMRQRLTDAGYACPNWSVVTSMEDAEDFCESHGGKAVAKTPTGGYDGKGVQLIRKDRDLANIAAWFAQGPVLLEELVPFTRELAALVARSPSGQASAWPVAQTVQVDGVCDEVFAPAPNLSDKDAAKITAMALGIAKELDVVGVLAVEIFATSDGRYLVNELAMRPHNSGHWTIDGAKTSQFEQHLRAVLDLPLGDTSPTARWTVMTNILGADHEHMYPAYLHVMARDPGVKVHMYGKDVTPGRKVGHVSVSGDDFDDVRARARHAADFLKGVIDE